MAIEERILAIDIGATSIKLCEFDCGNGDEVSLENFAYREYEEELSEGTRFNVVAGLLRQMLAEGGFRAKRALISLSGQSALMRFGRLGIVKYDKKQIRKLAEFEATNNIPFPVSEVLYDYQLIATEASDQIDVLSVVIKNEVVDQFTRAVMTVGCEPIHVDLAPVACFNAARANGLGDDQCVIILNIGGRNTSLLFAEGERFFARNIPMAGHSITQQIAKEFGIGLPEAEELKRRHGFVALGGAYAEPESETAANVSKIIRTVMARLHGEIARSINVYKSQQHGSAPVKMYLTGGSSVLNYCDVFFQEKLGIPVEYFNPFGAINLAPQIDKTRLGEVAHMFSEPIGLVMRYVSQCPIEIDLVPIAIQRQQRLSAKKPFFIVAGITVMLTLGILNYGIRNAADIYDSAAKNLETSAKYEKQLKDVQAQISEAGKYKSQNDEMEQELMKKCLLPNIFHEIALLRPDFLTITSIKPVYAEEPLDMSMDDTAVAGDGGGGEGAGMMMEGAGMMMDGGGGGGGEEVTAGETYSTQERIVYGYEITGFCFMPNTDSAQRWTPDQNYWTDFSGIIELPEKASDVEAEKKEEEAAQAAKEKAAAEAEENNNNDAEAADAENTADNQKKDEENGEGENEQKEPAEEDPAVVARRLSEKRFAKAEARMKQMKTPDQAFMENLLSSPLFDDSVNPRH
ncbi:MAG: type IV pilus assembly protein PilM, partial [Victivallales bacterium]|nr:type IV pilus assembly protein PilM [Victivallales bacterium]